MSETAVRRLYDGYTLQVSGGKAMLFRPDGTLLYVTSDGGGSISAARGVGAHMGRIASADAKTRNATFFGKENLDD